MPCAINRSFFLKWLSPCFSEKTWLLVQLSSHLNVDTVKVWEVAFVGKMQMSGHKVTVAWG